MIYDKFQSYKIIHVQMHAFLLVASIRNHLIAFFYIQRLFIYIYIYIYNIRKKKKNSYSHCDMFNPLYL